MESACFKVVHQHPRLLPQPATPRATIARLGDLLQRAHWDRVVVVTGGLSRNAEVTKVKLSPITAALWLLFFAPEKVSFRQDDTSKRPGGALSDVNLLILKNNTAQLRIYGFPVKLQPLRPNGWAAIRSC
jgi:hypothetical protein